MNTVMTFGVWDLFHSGHLTLLVNSRILGDQLVVGIASDEVVQRDKGQPPIISEIGRQIVLEGVYAVDRTIIYRQLEFTHLLEYVHPSVLTVGGDWGNAQRHRNAERWCEQNGCRVVHMPRTKGISTSLIKQRVLDLHRSFTHDRS